ncbi:Uma2 family endonuclease [Alienimonas sp. DA493]|uniref:Uma2 family endonuclease n=1 Tax=Alienimonas sp. DA493 TaxID=3373605 RepID=UPI00375450DB
MSTAAPLAASREIPRRLAPPLVLGGVSWRSYCEMRDDPCNERLRLTYDASSRRLGIAVPGKRHENVAELLGYLIATFGRMRRLNIIPVGSTTWRRVTVGGAEGDKAFHVGRPAAELNLDGNVPDLAGSDLPPDLVVEVDVTSSGVEKLPIYAGLGVPEVWVWTDDAIVVHRLTDDGYETVDGSVELPGFPLAFAAELIAGRADAATYELEEAFAERLRTDG